jgi:regulatory protein
MKVTAIQQQVKRANRYSIFIDGKYTLSLSDIGLLDSHLAVGQEFTEEELGELKNKAELDMFYGRVINYLAIRPRSEWEIQNYLKLKKCPTPLSEIILNKLRDKHLTDDSEFAKKWVENRRLLKPVSRRRLFSELRAKRVPTEYIEATLQEDKTDDRSVLAELVERKRKQTKYQDKLKLMQYLSRQGFNYDDIKSVLESD